ncbi:hypothetical protein [Nonomuraea gerenzanensis]|uniref:Uncharacterized protein n=1 Tax=Nonomuraea gerenzanensis TaxID=93944 RepID=A0A1M4EH68_9ACTN|nr:hypothetical protein [Nonomuraea gerenzanensis]UBU09856.1 hypothetical protein LCN96_36625 [Nonomuraea gerenzanensis]SBO98307.1 hypothetical protein BN4615_P7823 [Nonomuraea gerenzanensis]
MPHNGLSLPDFSAMVVLAVEAREISNTELKQRHRLTIDGQKRHRLNALKLVESRKPGRVFLHVLTDAGWARLAEDLRTGNIPPQTGSSGAMARALLDWLPRYMRRTDQSLAEVFQPDDESGETDDLPAGDLPAGDLPAGGLPAGDPAAGDLESRVRGAYAELAASPGTWVGLAGLREQLADVPRAQVDETLTRMERLPDVNLVPESNQKTLTPADREAAVLIGGQRKHLLWIGPA